MKVNLKIFLPLLPEVVGGKELEVEFAGETVLDLIDHLVAQYGPKAKQALYDENGSLDSMIQVLINGESWITSEQLEVSLEDGDEMVIMMMMAGG